MINQKSNIKLLFLSKNNTADPRNQESKDRCQILLLILSEFK